jgi:hypothetical protein
MGVYLAQKVLVITIEIVTEFPNKIIMLFPSAYISNIVRLLITAEELKQTAL